MNTLVQKFASIVKGTLVGFDRIVLKGSIVSLVYDKGVTSFCRRREILNKELYELPLSDNKLETVPRPLH